MFGLPLDSCDPIVDQLLVCVQDEELQDTVLEALSSLVSYPDTHKYTGKLLEVLKKIMSPDSVLNRFMSEGSFEMCRAVPNPFITFRESHSHPLID